MLVKQLVELYKKTAYILKDDENYYFGDTDLKYRDLVGEQAVLKVAADGSGALIIAHGFKDAKPITICNERLLGLEVTDVISSSNASITCEKGGITIFTEDFDAVVIHLKGKQNK